MDSPDVSKSLESKLTELETKAGSIEKLAKEVKENEKKLYDLANSTISYISQLKSKHKDNNISSVALADKLEKLMEKIEKDLGGDPGKASIDKTIEDLQKILKSSKSSDSTDSDKPSSSGDVGEKKGTGILDKALSTLSNILPGDDSKEKTGASAEKKEESAASDKSNEKPRVAVKDVADRPVISDMDKAVEAVKSSQEGPKPMEGGFRYSSKSKKSKKRRKSRKSKARGRKKSLTNKKRVKSHFTKTRKNSKKH